MAMSSQARVPRGAAREVHARGISIGRLARRRRHPLDRYGRAAEAAVGGTELATVSGATPAGSIRMVRSLNRTLASPMGETATRRLIRNLAFGRSVRSRKKFRANSARWSHQSWRPTAAAGPIRPILTVFAHPAVSRSMQPCGARPLPGEPLRSSNHLVACAAERVAGVPLVAATEPVARDLGTGPATTRGGSRPGSGVAATLAHRPRCAMPMQARSLPARNDPCPRRSGRASGRSGRAHNGPRP